jgi:hypothetical protein
MLPSERARCLRNRVGGRLPLRRGSLFGRAECIRASEIQKRETRAPVTNLVMASRLETSFMALLL